MIGADWSGVLGHDGYGTYDRFGHAVHQSCLAHVLRRARELLAKATRGAVRFLASVDRVVHRGDPPAQPVGRPSGTGPGAGTSSARGSTTAVGSGADPTRGAGIRDAGEAPAQTPGAVVFRSCSIPKSRRPTGRRSKRSARRWSTARCGEATGPEPVRTPKGSPHVRVPDMSPARPLGRSITSASRSGRSATECYHAPCLPERAAKQVHGNDVLADHSLGFPTRLMQVGTGASTWWGGFSRAVGSTATTGRSW